MKLRFSLGAQNKPKKFTELYEIPAKIGDTVKFPENTKKCLPYFTDDNVHTITGFKKEPFDRHYLVILDNNTPFDCAWIFTKETYKLL